MRLIAKFVLVFVALLAIPNPSIAAKKLADQGSKVQVHYTGKLTDGRIFDSSRNRDPLEFIIGKGQMLKDFEKAVLGMTKKEQKTITIPAKEAYGEVSEEKVFKVAREKMPKDTEIKPGALLNMRSARGRYLVRIVEANDDEVWVDANHILAGKDLIFDIELVGVN